VNPIGPAQVGRGFWEILPILPYQMKLFLIITAVILTFTALVVVFIYQYYGGKSSGPIKAYSFQGRVSDFLADVQRLSERDPTIIAKVTDITGNARVGHRYYIEIRMKYLYNICCDSSFGSHSPQTKIDLILALDTVNLIGGYGRVRGSQPIIDYFDDHFIRGLRDSLHVAIDSMRWHN
jgi:hypothetical protein